MYTLRNARNLIAALALIAPLGAAIPTNALAHDHDRWRDDRPWHHHPHHPHWRGDWRGPPPPYVYAPPPAPVYVPPPVWVPAPPYPARPGVNLFIPFN